MIDRAMRTLTLLLLAVAATAAPAAAQERLREARAACGADAKRFCDGIRPGGGRLMQCLRSNAQALSPTCQKFLQSQESGK